MRCFGWLVCAPVPGCGFLGVLATTRRGGSRAGAWPARCSWRWPHAGRICEIRARSCCSVGSVGRTIELVFGPEIALPTDTAGPVSGCVVDALEVLHKTVGADLSLVSEA